MSDFDKKSHDHLDESETSLNISPSGAAVLEFCSDIKGVDRRSINFIASKKAFVWAGISVLVSQGIDEYHQINEEIQKNDRQYFGQYKRMEHFELYQMVINSIPSSNSNLLDGSYHFDGSFHSDEFRQLDSFSRGDRYFYPESLPIEHDIFNRIIWSLASQLNVRGVRIKDSLEPRKFLVDAVKLASVGYGELIDNDFISDPVIETTLGITILGMLPFSIVKKTLKGQEQYLKIQSALWKYERKRKRDAIETNFTLNAVSVARTIKAALIAGFHEATKGEGDEPRG